MDDDLEHMNTAELAAEIKRMREAIRAHRDCTGHDLCWYQPKLWSLLPEQLAPEFVVPTWPKFMQGCVKFRQSLDIEAPGAKRVDDEY